MSDLDIVFDVGKVLIDFSYENFAKVLHRQGAELSGPEDFLRRVDLIGYERGAIGSTEFLAQLNALLRDPLPEDELIAAWVDLFSPVEEMLELAGNLKNHCGVYLLSNTSELHWRHLQQTYRLDRFCHGLLASYEVGAMKPAADIFTITCERFGLQPATTIFIDDREENVAGAIACGWQGIHHQSPAETRRRLAEVTGLDL